MARNKYRNIRTEVDGISFQSRREANYYVTLRALQKAGKMRFVMQVRYKFPSGITYVADFVEHWPGKEPIVTDTKGFRTPIYKIKKKLMLYHFGINVHEV